MIAYRNATRSAKFWLWAVLALAVGNSVFAGEKTRAPDGYSWQPLPDVQGSVLQPDGWYYRRAQAPRGFAYYLSRESIDKEGTYLAGLFVLIAEDVASNHPMSAAAMAAHHVQGCAQRYNASRVWNIAIDDYWGGGCDSLQWPPVGPLRLVTHIMMADMDNDTLYIVNFEMPETESKVVSGIRDVMLNSLTIGDKRLCLYGYGDGATRLSCTAEDDDIEHSLTLRELGALPVNEVSDLFETKASGIANDTQTLESMFQLIISPRRELPDHAYIEATFPNPADVSKPLTVDHHRRDGETEISFLSPAFKGLKCRNYKVTVNAYADSGRAELIGTHRQLIQSRVDLSLVESDVDLMRAMQSGRCPTARHGR